MDGVVGWVPEDLQKRPELNTKDPAFCEWCSPELCPPVHFLPDTINPQGKRPKVSRIRPLWSRSLAEIASLAPSFHPCRSHCNHQIRSPSRCPCTYRLVSVSTTDRRPCPQVVGKAVSVERPLFYHE